MANTTACFLLWSARQRETQAWPLLQRPSGHGATVEEECHVLRQGRRCGKQGRSPLPTAKQTPAGHTLYCSRWRRPLTCISRALWSLKLHSHSWQWNRITLPSSLHT